MLADYLKRIVKTEKRGDAREESYYPDFSQLIQDLANHFKRKKIEVTTLPKKTDAGNPDFRIWDGEHNVIGYIEAKLPGSDLRKIEDSEQLKRYRSAFPNVILTDYYEFWLYRDGELVEKAELAYYSVSKATASVPPVKDEEKFLDLFESFFSFQQPVIYSAKDLAVTLAKRTRHLEKIVLDILEKDKNSDSDIHLFYKAFQETLISGLGHKEFSDLYAQTITYGLFAAKSRTGEKFSRKVAFDNIPKTIGILKKLFQYISLEPHQDIEWIVDDIASVLESSDIKKIMDDFYREGKGIDPIIHFYETFLAVYDPKLREKRGVYYTPEPVVSYIVRSVNQIIKDQFDKSAGLGDASVTVLDPAAGTLTFIAHAFNIAMDEYIERSGEGGKTQFVKKHLLKNFYAFELMMAPYAIGHLKMGFVLEELGYKLKDDERFNLFLTNTLEMEDLHIVEMPGIGRSLSEESKQAGKIKKEQPVLVILGNPPYSGRSANKHEHEVTLLKDQNYISHYDIIEDDNYYKLKPVLKKATKKTQKKQKTWIGEQVEQYKIVDGQWLGEKNPKWLQDDYVKFIRFAQWKIEQTGSGVIGMITNHGYLDNPTFRGMRRSLLNTFDQIYVLDLHGNYNKKEKAPDGSKDENVFDIKQGVSIVFLVKQDGLKQAIKRADLFGVDDLKYKYLNEFDLSKTKWKKIEPTAELYLFTDFDAKLHEHYKKNVSVSELFPLSCVGIVTARDKLTIDYSDKKLWDRINRFIGLDTETARMHFDLGVDTRDWKVSLAQEDLRASGPNKDNLEKIAYRPFDVRYTYFTGKTKGFICMPRKEIMKNMLNDNVGLLLPKRVESDILWSHIFCSNTIIDHVVVSLKTIDYLFPLYLYPDEDKHDLFAEAEKSEGKKPNINEKYYDILNKIYKRKPTPEEVLYYTYGILYSTIYRKKYAEFLKYDFPRIPFTSDIKLFLKIAKLGEQLTELHLLKSKKLDKPISKFHGQGSNRLGKTKKECRNYNSEEKRVYINNEAQYFDNIEPEVWEYQIGGYQVLDKWLDSHKERVLELEDIEHFQKVVTSLSLTIVLQQEIDNLYPDVEKEIIEFN